jgi:hypothetical protein
MSNGRARSSIPMPLDEPADDDAIDSLLESCREARDRGEHMSNELAAEYAMWAGTSSPTLRRWIREGRPAAERKKFKLDQDAGFTQALAMNRTIAHTVRKRELAGIAPVKSIRTYQRAARRELGEYVLVALRDGERAARQHELTIRQHATHRNAAWHIDGYVVRRRVLTANGRGVLDAHALLVTDSASGAIPGGVVVRDEPDLADALHTIGEAMRKTPDLWVPHGAPEVLYHDNAAIYTSPLFWTPLRQPLINVRCQATPPFTPRGNGRVERNVGTLRTLLATPLENGSLVDLTGKPLVDSDRAAVPLATLIAEIKAACVEHNNLPYRENRKISKAQAWQELPGTVRPVPDALLSQLMRRARVIVKREGVLLENEYYLHHSMRKGHILGHEVEVRYRDMDDTWVEVHYAGKRLGTALNTRILAADEDERKPLINTRATDRRLAETLLAEAQRMSLDYAQSERDKAIAEAPQADAAPRPDWESIPDPCGYDRDTK